MASCCGSVSDATETTPLHDNIGGTYTDTSMEDRGDPGGNQRDPEALSDPDKDTGARKGSALGYVILSAALLGYTLSMTCSQALDKSVPHSELNVLRFTTQLVLATVMVIGTRCSVKVEKDLIGWVLLFSVLNTAQSYAQYGKTYYLPLGVGSGSQESMTVIFAFIVNALIYRKCSWYETLAAILCLVGVLLLTEPKFIFQGKNDILAMKSFHSRDSRQPVCHVGPLPTNTSLLVNVTSFDEVLMMSQNNTDDVHMTSQTNNELIIGYVLCALGAAALVVEMYTIQSRLYDIKFYVVCFWDGVFGATVSVIIMSVSEVPYFPVLPICRGILFTHMFLASFTTFSSFVGFQMLDPLISSLMHTMTIIVMLGLQRTVMYNILPGNIDVYVICGIIVVVAGNAFVPLYMLIQQYQDDKKKNKDEMK